MESEKVKEILKFCSEGKDCYDGCPYKHDTHCVMKISKEALTLINELESDNKKLKRYKLDWLNSEKMHLQADIEDTEFELFCANNSLEKVRAENKELKDRIAELEKEKTCVWEEWTDGDHSIWCCSNCKEDFCFIEGDVYESNYGYCPHCGAKITALKELQEEEIDETLKEFIND